MRTVIAGWCIYFLLTCDGKLADFLPNRHRYLFLCLGTSLLDVFVSALVLALLDGETLLELVEHPQSISANKSDAIGAVRLLEIVGMVTFDSSVDEYVEPLQQPTHGKFLSKKSALNFANRTQSCQLSDLTVTLCLSADSEGLWVDQTLKGCFADRMLPTAYIELEHDVVEVEVHGALCHVEHVGDLP